MQELLHHLVVKCTASQFNLLLLMIKEGLNCGYLRVGNYRVSHRFVNITSSHLNSCNKAEDIIGCGFSFRIQGYYDEQEVTLKSFSRTLI